MNYLIFGGVKSSDFNIFVSGKEKIKMPKKDVEFVSVPGRNGDIEFDNNRYENVIIKYPAYIPSSLLANYDKITDWLTRWKGYVRLEDSFNPKEFRFGVFHKGLEVEPSLHHVAGRFDLEFNCKPQRFLVSGNISEVVTTQNYILKNPTSNNSKPLITVVGGGTVSVNNNIITIPTNSYSQVRIDCETETVTGGSYTNINNLVNFSKNEFFYFQTGNNYISFTGFTQVVVVPRWWIL